MTKNLPDISKPDGLVEYLLRRLGLSKSNVKSKIICDNQQQGRVISATQISWNQCVGHYFYGKEKSPDVGNQVFLPHKLLLFDVRERVGEEEFLKEFHVIFLLSHRYIEDSDLISLCENKSFEDFNSRDFGFYKKIQRSFLWEEQYGSVGKVASTKVYPRRLGDFVVQAVKSEYLSMCPFVSLDRDSKIYPSGIFHFHPRLESKAEKNNLIGMKYVYQKQADDLSNMIRELNKQLANFNDNKWNK
jgi:hypothetical protein